MVKCKICGNQIEITNENYLTINNVPEETFNFSDKTLSLYVVNCNNCGAVFLHNVLMSKDYEAVYRSLRVSQKHRQFKKDELERYIIHHNIARKNFIEIGCGDGQYLEIFREIGANVSGVEYSVSNYEKCIKNNFNVTLGTVKDLKNQYDGFFCFYFLEHLPNPVDFVKDLFRILKPGGLGLIEIPSYDCIEKENVWLEFTKDHRFYYREKTLRFLLTLCGFNIYAIGSNEDTLTLFAVVTKSSPFKNFDNMKNQIDIDIDGFNKLVNDIGNDYILFGAGHYSQLLLNNCDVKPKYIFDSNKQKCGNKLCGVLIQHKDEFKDVKDCDNVIISCGIYNSEVHKMLSEIAPNKNYVMWE